MALLRPKRRARPDVEADGLPSLLENPNPKEGLAPIQGKTEPDVGADGLPSLLGSLHPKEGLAPMKGETEPDVEADGRPSLQGLASAVGPVQPPAGAPAQGGHQAKPAGEAQADAPSPPFAGRWVQTRVVGNMDQLMAEGGLAWPVRQMAKGMGYGVGKTFLTISQDGDAMTILQEIPTKKPYTAAFVVGEPGWQETEGVDGRSLVMAAWDGPTLVLDSKTPGGRVFPTTRRWVDPRTDELVISTKTAKGEEVLRIFARR